MKGEKNMPNNNVTNLKYYGSFDEAQLDYILDTCPLKKQNGTYDFHGASVNNLIIKESGITVKNVTIKNTMLVKEGCSLSKLENVRFEGSTQPVIFENDTHKALFECCTFVGNNTPFAMNADTNVNTDVVISNCYFYSFKEIINVAHKDNQSEPVKLNATFTGGWCDGISYVVHSCADVDANLIFNGFDFEGVINVFKCDRGNQTHSNVIINSMLGDIIHVEENPLNSESTVSVEGVVYFTNGTVNLECNAPIISSTKLFCDEAPDTRYCNVKQFGESEYPF